MEYRGLKLDAFQESAIHAIENGHSVLVAAPTGAGKTLIAEYALEKVLGKGAEIIYTAPIKALSNQKFRDFTATFGNRIGIVTGDVSINPDAPVLIMTTEIFRNTIFDNPQRLKRVSYVIFDEVHYLDDGERGTVWEESIIFAPSHIKIIALSATIPNLKALARWIRKVRGNNLEVIEETERPVPLKDILFIKHFGVGNLKDLKRVENRILTRHAPRHFYRRHRDYRPAAPSDRFRWERKWKNELVDHLIEQNRLPCLYFVFSQQGCEERGQENLSRDLLTAAERKEIITLFNHLCQHYGVDVNNDTAALLARTIARGIAFHHAGMLPILKEVVEQLFTRGLIKLLFATETFAVGINMPAKTVVFDALTKFDGIRRTFFKSREYQQMAGRAGRRGMDETGFVYSNIELPRLRSRDVQTIISGELEPIRSQFNLSYACLLNLYGALKENIYQACKKSFSNFQMGLRRHKRKKFHLDVFDYNKMLDQVKRKLSLLEELGYLHRGDLTHRGHFARQIYGYELPLTELFTRGIINGLSPDEINILMVALVFESKRRGWYRKLDATVLGRFRKPTIEITDEIIRKEKRAGIAGTSKIPDFKLSGAAYAWSTGATFAYLSKWTDTSDGDLVRTFRLAIQLLRQLERAMRKTDRVDIPNIREAFHKLHRDEIDAEHYLQLNNTSKK